MKNSNVIIYGTGGLAELISAFLNEESRYTIVGYCVEQKYRNNLEKFNGLPLIDFEDLEDNYPPSEYSVFVAVGNNYTRERIFAQTRRKGYTMISHITESVLHWNDLRIGENVLISGSSSLQPFVSVNDNTLIIGSKIGHHSEIGNHVLLSCTTIGGNVTIRDYSFLGLNSAVQHNTVIAEKNIIGMGCNIDRNTKENEVYSSSKATIKRVVSSEQIKDTYM